ERQFPARDIDIDAAKRHDLRLALAEGLRHSATRHRKFRRHARHRDHPLKTMAGSSTSTRRMLMKLARKTITMTATATIAITCQGRKKPCSATAFLVDSKNRAAKPMPMP